MHLQSTSRLWLLLLSALVLWSTALFIRRAVLAQQTRTVEGEPPFLLESALQFRMTRLVGEGAGIPRHEPAVQYPEGVDPRKTYSIGAEYVYTFFARFLPTEWTFASRIRWVSAGLFSLAVPLAALWTGLRSRSWWGGWTAGLLLAVSPAFAVRSSGLELSRENLAFPFMTLFLVMEVLTERASSPRRRWFCATLAGLALAFAQVFWDMSQYLIGLWIVGQWIQGRRERACGEAGAACEVPHPALLFSVSLALTIAGLLNPYLRSKGFLFSPVMTLVLARVLYFFIPASVNRRFRLAAAPLFFVGWQALGGLFVVNYSHFGELLWAKLRFLNVKPEDPGLLTYIQRIMWTPALNSSTWELTKAYFPITLWALLVASVFLLLLRWAKHRTESVAVLELYYAGATFVLYILFFRFHVFLILFAAGCIGSALSLASRLRSRGLRMAVPLLSMVFLTGVEFYHLLFFEPAQAKALREQQETRLEALRSMGFTVPPHSGDRWGRPGAGYTAVSGLTTELRALGDAEPGPVLAGFGISGNILADAGLPILLHPKFETPGIRERVRQFYEHLFLRSEKEMRDWAVSFLPAGEAAPQAFYYVHSLGSLAGGDTRESPRYMVDALTPPPEAAVHLLENRPRDAVWFRPVGGNAKFRIYRIITPADERAADAFAEQARRAWERGDVETARNRARRALAYHWKHEAAQQMLSRLNWRE